MGGRSAHAWSGIAIAPPCSVVEIATPATARTASVPAITMRRPRVVKVGAMAAIPDPTAGLAGGRRGSDAAMADVEAARRALEDALGADRLHGDPLTRRLYARDASMVEGWCELVAFPRSTQDVVACVRAAADHGLAVVPRGSGTGLAGASTPISDALVVVTTKMTAVLEVRPEDRLAWVEPGVPNLDLSAALQPHGFTFAPDPSSQQTYCQSF